MDSWRALELFTLVVSLIGESWSNVLLGFYLIIRDKESLRLANTLTNHTERAERLLIVLSLWLGDTPYVRDV